MTLNELLTELKLPKEKLDSLWTAINSEYVAKSEYEKLSDGFSSLKTEYERISDNLSALRSEHKKKSEFLKQSAEDRLNRQKAAYEAQIKEQLTEIALTDSGAKNNEIVKSLLDTEKVILKEGKLIGLEPQIRELRKKAPFLFENSLAYLIGYRPEPSSDLLPKVSPSDMTYSQAVAYLEHFSD